MAAFKESGAVEYAMNTGLVLRPVLDAEDEIDVSVPKNKRGLRVPFRLRRDPVQCSLPLRSRCRQRMTNRLRSEGSLKRRSRRSWGRTPGVCRSRGFERR